MTSIAIRPAQPADVPVLERLIAESARGLAAGFYTAREIEAAIDHVFGVDSALVQDGTYLVATIGGRTAGCGGWSRRRTLFGGDRMAGRDDGWLDPAVDPARIRAFFTAPAFARAGVASKLLAACESAVEAAGFSRLTLMATLPGRPFYEARGFAAGRELRHACGSVSVRFQEMEKDLLSKKRQITGEINFPS